MGRGLNRRAGALLVAMLGMMITTAPAWAQQPLLGYLPDTARGAAVIGRLSAAEPIQLTLSLPLRNEGELHNLIQRMYDPTDPMHGQYLTPESFTARFGPTQTEYDTVAAYAAGHGLAIVGTHSNRLLLDVAGPAQAVENAFGVELWQLKGRDGRVFHAPDRNPTVPDYVAACLSGVIGLDDEAVIQTHSQRLAEPALSPRQVGTGPNGALSPTDIRKAYDLTGANIPTGSGQTLAVFELDGYHPADITAYESYFGLPAVPLKNVLVDGYSGAAGAGAPEVTLDIELMLALAPGASQIMVYEAPNSSSGLVDEYNRIATDNTAKEISTSWGLSETQLAFILGSENSIFTEMAAQGQSIFAASGDSGAYDNGSTLSVDDPSSQPYVVGVGGTSLAVAAGGIWSGETTWNGGSIAGGGGGGGISVEWPIPSWQKGLVLPASLGSTTKRNVPDVSLDANPNTGYSIYYNGGWTIYGGTSCAAPLWAAFAAIANQARTTLGAGLLGFPDPLLYQIGAGANYRLDFHDIADGSTNLFYPAIAGYDDATGWGSFNGAELLADLAPGFLRPPLAPTGLMATPGNGQIALAWTASTGAASYNVKRATVSGGPYTTVASPTTNSYTNTGLTNGTNYYYVISAVNGSGESANSAQVSAIPQNAAPPAPTNLAAAAGNAQAALSWNAASGATSYNVKRSTTSGGPYATVSSPTTNSYTDTGLTNGTTYYYVVSAANGGGESANSTEVSATPQAPVPAVPTGLTALAEVAQNALSWSPTNYAVSYNVKRATTSGGPYTTVGSPTTSSFTDTGLTNGTTYYYVISAVDGSGESANSLQVSAEPADAAAIFLGADTSTQGSWKGVYGGDGYNVFEDSASYPAYASLTPSAAKRDYTWNSAPTDVRALARGTLAGRIAACWYNPTGYSMDLSLTDGQAHRVALYFLDWEPCGRTETVQVLDASTGAVLDTQTVSGFSGGTYLVWTLSGHVTIKVTNAGVVNMVCSGIFFDAGTAGAVSVPAAPTGLAVAVGDGKIGLTWTPSSFAVSYNVKRSTTSGGPYTTIASPTTASYTDTGLTNGTTYYYVISAVNGRGESANSSQVSAMPGKTSATFLGADTSTQGSWKGVYGGDGYNVFEDSASYPAYASLTPSAAKRDYTWNSAPTDVRALQRGSASGSIAACWYNPTGYSMDLSLTDGQAHRVALYFLDWEPCGRTETVQVLDASTGAVLDTQTVSGFKGGTYLVWTLSGHVTIKITNAGLVNMVCSGIFFDAGTAGAVSVPAAPTGLTAAAGDGKVGLTWTPCSFAVTYNVKRATTSGGPYTTVGSPTTASFTDTGLTNGTTYYYVISAVNGRGESANSFQVSAMPAKTTAAFLGTDTSTQGSWKSVYGADGYNVFEDSASYPAYASLTPSAAKRDYTWNSAPTDVRALQRGSASGSIAACWYNPTGYQMDLNLTDGLAHRVALYFLDWEPCGRTETVQVLDASTGAVLDTQTVSGFKGGVYLVWTLSGHVTIKITNTGLVNMVCSGIFFG